MKTAVELMSLNATLVRHSSTCLDVVSLIDPVFLFGWVLLTGGELNKINYTPKFGAKCKKRGE